MNKLKSGILLAYAILAMSAPAVLAAQPADADNQTAGAALVNMDSPNDKEASKDCSGSDKTSSETDHDTLIPVESDMLSDADFSVNGIGLDSTVDSVKAKLHNPDSAISRGIYDEYDWKGISVEALKPFLNKYVNRKDLSIGSQIKHTGISKIVITSDSIKTARGVTAGMNRESVLRKFYGKSLMIHFAWYIKKKIIYLLLISTMILLVQLTLAVEIQAHMKSGHPSTQFRVQSLRFLQMTLI